MRAAVPRRQGPLARLALAAHAGLALALTLTVGGWIGEALPRALAVAIVLLPLLGGLPGLLAGRRETLRWLTVALVAYAGVGAVEVIASGDAAAIAVLLCALLELALLLILIRAPRPPVPRAAGES